MKTLYVNINNEKIQSNEELEVLKHDLDSDFFFYLGEKIAKGCKVENENALITDFNSLGNEDDYKQITAQWNEIKTILFSEECNGNFEFTLPNGYIHWLKFHPQYVSVYDRNFSHGEPAVIAIDLEELYEDSVEDLQRKILRKLQRDDLYLEIDEIVFNDNTVTRKSPIVCKIKEKYEGIGFKSYKKWLQDNDEKPHTSPQVCEKCKKNPCECNIEKNDLFPFLNVVLGETSVDEIAEGNLQFEEYNGFKAVQCEDFIFITNPYSDIIATLQLNEVPVVGHDFPKILSDKLGVNWATSYDDCQKELLKRNYTIRLKKKDVEIDGENHNIIVAESPNHKYILELIFFKRSSRTKNKGDLNMIHVHLKKCPNCGEENLYIVTDKFPFTYQCKNKKCSHEWTLIPKEIENEIVTPNCPNCSSDDVDDDGSVYLQYTCNDCGHNWGHDDTVECPECGSDDVENDGTDYLQYTCNDCGHNWGDDEDEDDFDDDEEENFSHPLSLNDFFPVCGITLNKSTVKDAERQSYRYAEIEYCDGGCVIAFSKNGEYHGAQIRKEANSNLFTNIYITSSDIMFPEWSRLGFDWKLSYNDWISLFKRMGFTIIQTEEPRIESWEHGPDYFYTKIVAISKDYSLKFELVFSYGSDGNTRYSRSTLYSISVYSKDYSYDYGGHICKKTFYNIEDFLRKEPKKYL